jgi:hypothetical protein
LAMPKHSDLACFPLPPHRLLAKPHEQRNRNRASALAESPFPAEVGPPRSAGAPLRRPMHPAAASHGTRSGGFVAITYGVYSWCVATLQEV